MTLIHTILPQLPRQHKQQEVSFGVLFRSWWDENKMLGTFELKHTRGKNYFNLSEIHHEQKVIGKLASGEGVLLRLSSGTTGLADYIGLIKFPVFIVIKYPKCFFIIPLHKIIDLISQGKKSITIDECIKSQYPQVFLGHTKK